MQKSILLACILCCTLLWAAPMQILFIGNSYTFVNDMPSMFHKLAQSAGKQVNITQHTVGGESLCGHANNTEVQQLFGLHWDLVVLQDFSQNPSFVPTRNKTLACIRNFYKPKMLASRTSNVVFYGTWGRRTGDPAHMDLFPTFPTMQVELTAGYESYASAILSNNNNGVIVPRIAPVGLSYYEVYRDLQLAKRDPLASDALFYRLYASDGSHPSVLGTYIAANCMYMRIFDESPEGNAYVPAGITKEEQTYLQQVVARFF